MRLLHILAERGFSGGEVQLRYLLTHLVERGHDNLLVLQPGARFAETAAQLSIPVEEVRMRGSGDPLAIARLRRSVRRAAPDLVHFACSRSHKLGALATIGSSLPRVVTRRMDYRLRRGAVSRWLYGRAVDRAVVISDAIGAALQAAGVPAQRIVRIYEGVDPADFVDVRRHRGALLEQLGWPDDAFVCLCAASLRPRKGQVHLLRAFARAAAAVPRARLLLAGEGSERAALEAEVERLGLAERVRLPGQLPGAVALGAADLSCIPSLLEGLSVFSLESMAAGLPVLASATGGLPESVADGVTGRLAAPGDDRDWERVLGELLRDVEGCRRMGEAGRVRLQQYFTASGMADRTEKLYEELVAQPRR